MSGSSEEIKASIPPPTTEAPPQNELIGGGLKATISGWFAEKKKTAILGIIVGLLYVFMFRYVKAQGIDPTNPNGVNPNKNKIMQAADKLRNKNK